MKRVIISVFAVILGLNALAASKDTIVLTPEEYEEVKVLIENQKKQRAADEKNVHSAVKWHGEVVSSVQDDIAMTMTHTFKDGWVLVVKSAPKKNTVKTPQEIKKEREAKKRELAKRMPIAAAEASVAAEYDKPEEIFVNEVVTPPEK